MSNILLRGLSPARKRDIERLANSKNLSLNQMFLEVIKAGLERWDKEREAETRRLDVFRRIRKFQKEMGRKYGKFEESWKLIREDRDSR